MTSYRLDWSNKDAVERWMSARPTRNTIIEYLRDGWDSSDTYGSTLACKFAIADVLTEINSALVPEDWHFQQGLGGSDTESWEYRAIVEAMRDGGATLADLEHAAKVFERLDRINRLTGLEY